MYIDSLVLFLAVVDCKSFSEAAFEKNISQSALSKQIKNLEQVCGTKLFDRSKHTIHLTDAGEVFAAHAETVVSEYNAMKNSMTTFNGTGTEYLRIASSPVLHLYEFSSMIKTFLNSHPDTHVQIDESPLFSIIKELDRLSIDLAIVRSEAFPDKEGFQFIPLIEDEVVFLCSDKNRLAKNKTVSISQINQENLVLLKPAIHEYLEILHEHGFELSRERNIFMLYAAFSIPDYIREVNYSSIMMKEMAEMLCKKPGISMVPIEGRPKTSLDIVIKDRNISIMAERFIEVATAFFAKE